MSLIGQEYIMFFLNEKLRAALQKGKGIARKGWHGKKMEVVEIPAEVLEKAISEFLGKEVKAKSTLFLKLPDGVSYRAWNASQDDALEDDWEIVE